MKAKNYTAINFVVDGEPRHMTWVYGLKDGALQFPPEVLPGDQDEVLVIGTYNDHEVGCLVVEWNGATHQPSGTLLHITTYANGVPPVQSGLRATAIGYQAIEPYTLKGVWG